MFVGLFDHVAHVHAKVRPRVLYRSRHTAALLLSREEAGRRRLGHALRAGSLGGFLTESIAGIQIAVVNILLLWLPHFFLGLVLHVDAQRCLVTLHVNLADQWTAFNDVYLPLGSFLRTVLNDRCTQCHDLFVLSGHRVVAVVLDDLDAAFGLRQLSRAVDTRPARHLWVKHGISLQLVLVEVLEVLSDCCVLLLDQL